METSKKIEDEKLPLIKRIRKNSKLMDNMSSSFLLGPYVLLFGTFIILPVLMAIALSFTQFDTINSPEFIGLDNYIRIFTSDDVFLENIIPNTLKFAILVGPGGFILSFIMAWMLAQIQAGPRKYFALLLYIPSLAGPVLITILWKTLFNGSENGYINAMLLQFDLIEKPIQFLQDPKYILNIMIVVSLWSSMGIGFLAMLAGILNVDKTLYEAAQIDGIRNRFQEIIYITIPASLPQMLFGAVMAVVGAFTNASIGVALTGSNPTPGYAGSLIVNHMEDYGFLRYEMGYASALSVVLFLIIAIFSKLSYRLFSDND